MAKCEAWCNKWTCDGKGCLSCGPERGCPSKLPLPPTPPLMPSMTMGKCVGAVQVHGFQRPAAVIRNTGGGSASCCHMHPKAAPAGLMEHHDGLELMLLPRTGSSRVNSRNGARVYLGESCTEGQYTNAQYGAWKLLGKTLSITVDLSQATCGCNAAFYLVAMKQNTKPGERCFAAAALLLPHSGPFLISSLRAGNCDGDFYCDANDVCGVRCLEIDLIEANTHAFRTTIHSAEDGNGIGAGLGGSVTRTALSAEQYGPGSSVIDTQRPFRVHSYFGTDAGGTWNDLIVTLEGASGATASLSVPAQIGYFASLSPELALGVTPVMSYWANSDIHSWFDGGVCPLDDMDACGNSVFFYDLAVHDGHVQAEPPTPASPSPHPPPTSPSQPLRPKSFLVPSPPPPHMTPPYLTRHPPIHSHRERKPSPRAERASRPAVISTQAVETQGYGVGLPIFLMLVGMGLLLASLLRRDRSHRSTHPATHKPTVEYVGAAPHEPEGPAESGTIQRQKASEVKNMLEAESEVELLRGRMSSCGIRPGNLDPDLD